MVFVFTFAVGGGGGKIITMPNWALVSFFFPFSFFFKTVRMVTLTLLIFFNLYRILLAIQIIVNDSPSF